MSNGESDLRRPEDKVPPSQVRRKRGEKDYGQKRAARRREEFLRARRARCTLIPNEKATSKRIKTRGAIQGIAGLDFRGPGRGARSACPGRAQHPTTGALAARCALRKIVAPAAQTAGPLRPRCLHRGRRAGAQSRAARGKMSMVVLEPQAAAKPRTLIYSRAA